MGETANTLFLRLEGPLQAWGDTSKFVIRRTMEAPTKSGVMGLICCAMGISRPNAREHLARLNALLMGVRADRPGTRWWDYQTVGAGTGNIQAKGGVKINAITKELETLVTRREYLCDGSFLVALQGDPALVAEVGEALTEPRHPVFLGRKCCPPTRPLLEGRGSYAELTTALQAQPWRPRYREDRPHEPVDCLVEWRKTAEEPTAPAEAEVWYDVAVAFDPPVHEPRLVKREGLTVEVGDPLQQHVAAPPRPRADYRDTSYARAREQRHQADHGLCVFCKAPATTVQHVTYRRAGGHERQEDLRSLCRLCHDAVTMLEYGWNMGLDRINPEEERWREDIIAKRDDIIHFRSRATRRRRLAPEEVE